MVKRTLQEIADFFGCWVAVDESRLMVYGYHSEPKLGSNTFNGEFIGGVGSLEFISDLPEDWKDSLTAPSETPFKEGELVVHLPSGNMYPWAAQYVPDSHRRPTEAEWLRLRGEI